MTSAAPRGLTQQHLLLGGGAALHQELLLSVSCFSLLTIRQADVCVFSVILSLQRRVSLSSQIQV